MRKIHFNTEILRRGKKQRVRISVTLNKDFDGCESMENISVFEGDKQIKNYSIAEVIKSISAYMDKAK